MSTDTYCIWNEYTNDFDISYSSYVNDINPEPLQTLIWANKVKESDFMEPNEFESYPEGEYVDLSPPHSPSISYALSPLVNIPLYTQPDMSTWECLTPVSAEKVEKEASPQFSTHLWSSAESKLPSDFNMKTDPDTIKRFRDENKLEHTWDSMDKALYSVYMNQTDHKTFYTLLHKYSNMSHTAMMYIKWRLESEPLPSMEDLEVALGRKAPEGWRTQRKSELLKTIRKMVGNDINQSFRWDLVWCDIPTSKGSGFVNYGYIITNIYKKSKPQGRLLSAPAQTKHVPAPQQPVVHSQSSNTNPHNRNRNNNNNRPNNNNKKYTNNKPKTAQ